MSLFGQKKSRTSRALRVDAAAQLRRRLTEMIRDRSLWLRSGIVGAAVLALLVVVEGWQAPFPYRLNDLSVHGIEAAVDFQRVDRLETERQRDRREAETPPVFRNDPARLAGLPARFRDHLTQVALVRHLDELPTETRIAFGLAVADTFAPDPATAESLETEFAALKSHIAPQDGVMGAPFDETCDAFARLVEPLSRLGLVDPQELERLGIPIDRPLAIDTPVAAAPSIPVAAAESRTGPPRPEFVFPARDEPDEGGTQLLAAAFVPPGSGGDDGAGPPPGDERPPVPAVAVVPEPAAPAPATAASEPGRASVPDGGPAAAPGTTPADGRPRYSRSVVSQSEVRTAELVRETGRLGRALSSYPRLEPIRAFVRRWLVSQSPVTLQYDALATQQARSEARRNVPDHTIPFTRGMRLVGPGERIDAAALEVLQAEHEAVLAEEPLQARLVRAATVLALLTVLAALQGTYMVRHAPQLVGHSGRLTLYLTTIVVAVLVARWLSHDPWRAEIIPVMAAVAVLAIAYDQVLATFTAVAVALLVSVSTAADPGQFMVLLAVSTVAIVPLRSVPSRSSVVKVGFLAAATYVVVHWGLGLLESRGAATAWTDRTLLVSSLRGGFWCLVAGYLVSGSLPFVESAFGVVTDISLLEMSDVSHPLLQELVRRAPGTYNHSVAVATIGEAAADRIGANGLLVRVGAYFHDIGKMLKPQYFVENMTEGTKSRHENLAPAMSTLIIIGHVKDGVDLARRHHLPRPLVDFIEQHHGTTLVEYFYREAARTAEDPDDVQESAFRYPGPRPQTRETGVLMLADAVESASRTLSDPTPARIEGLVHEITMKKLLDGQFEESNLTLSEIHAVEDSLCKSLIGIYHGRIKYPDQRTA